VLSVRVLGRGRRRTAGAEAEQAALDRLRLGQGLDLARGGELLRAYARAIGDEAYRRPGEYFSGEFFLHARCRAVADGKEAYERVLADPQRMPKNLGFEGLLELATLAYEQKTGKDYEHVPTPDYETFANEAGWPRPE
jgi:hypothetical protein